MAVATLKFKIIGKTSLLIFLCFCKDHPSLRSYVSVKVSALTTDECGLDMNTCRTPLIQVSSASQQIIYRV